MKSMERVLTSLSFIEPDRVPLFLLFTMHGAKELKISIQEYFSKSESVVEGQLLLRQKYEHDCYYSFYYAAIETEAFGGEVIYQEDGPPNAGKPIFTKETGWKIAKETIAKIGGLVAVHFASGISNPIIENTIMSGASIVGVSFLDSLEDIKILSYQKASILGNLDGIKMASWTEDEAEENVKRTIQKVGEGGGFILSDNHGEIPYQVPNFVLQKISDSVKKWGRYPLQIN
ncbi:MAG: hypothetical protein H7A23_13070 [Leptospiraceae bacterium]|nr:hypothetical protein [Leptospiraceae bacterium]